jgi:hypothetical protein
MPLFHVQDGDRPMWVVANSFTEAHVKWAEKVAQENDCSPLDLDMPSGVTFVCEDDDLLERGK